MYTYLYRNLHSNPRVSEVPSELNSLARSNLQLVGVSSKLNSLELESSTLWSPQQVEFTCARAEGQGRLHRLRPHWFRLFLKGKEGCTASAPTGSGSL